MTRLEAIEPDRATGRGRELLDQYAERGGRPGSMVLTMAQAPTRLRARLIALNVMTGAFNLVAGILLTATARGAA